ncbi:MAG: hypothetical protein WC962_03480 [Phycisphaerae bacterium]|jgi:hypothetical protein
MAFPDFASLKTMVARMTGYDESGLSSSLNDLFNSEIHKLATNARPLYWRNQNHPRFPREGIIYHTVATAYGVLGTGREPIMYIKTENVAETSYAEQYFIGIVNLAWRPSTDADLATFTDGGTTVYDWNMLVDDTLPTWVAGAGGDYDDERSLIWTPIQELSSSVADYEQLAYDGHTATVGSATTYTGVTLGEPEAYVLEWKLAKFGKTKTGNEANSRGLKRAYIKVYPPNDDTFTFKMRYRRRPALLSADADVNEITRDFPMLIVKRVAYEVLRSWIRNADAADQMAIAADEELTRALDHQFDQRPVAGTKIIPSIHNPFNPRKGMRGN